MATNPAMIFITCLQIFNNVDHNVNLYGEAVQVDYRGTEVSVHAFLRVLTGEFLVTWCT
jgi:glycosylphosphatidylinositol transamidase (GPIT) subunit GPI8